MVAPAADLRPFAVPPHRQRPTGLGQEGTDYREAARRPVAGQNGALGPVDPDQITTQCVDDGGGKGGHGRDARQHDTTGGADLCVRRGDAGGEGGVVGKVETVGAGGERGRGRSDSRSVRRPGKDRAASTTRSGVKRSSAWRGLRSRSTTAGVPPQSAQKVAARSCCRPATTTSCPGSISSRARRPPNTPYPPRNDDPHRQRRFPRKSG